MPLPEPVPYFSQHKGLNGLAIDDPTGCWYACAKMMGVYYEGSFFRSRKGVRALMNPNGTHQSLGAEHLREFQINEKLVELPSGTPLNTAKDFDSALTQFGPIMFTWWVPGPEFDVFHASVIVACLDRDVVFHDPEYGPNQAMEPSSLQAKRSGGDGVRYPMLIRNDKFKPKKQVDLIAPKSLSLASDSYSRN
jgi:hypothetical protein